MEVLLGCERLVGFQMYERLLDKSFCPTFDDLLLYSGESAVFWRALDSYLIDSFSAQRLVRFPYGNKYGWSCKYSVKRKHICDIFAENEAFSLHFRVENERLGFIYDGLSDYARAVCDNRYDCGEGGWLTYRMQSACHVADAKKLLALKG